MGTTFLTANPTSSSPTSSTDTNLFTFSFQCSTLGKQFLSGQTFYKHLTATCQANKTWSVSEISDPCECESQLFVS